MCLSCADACAAEEMDMRQCIRLCLDCADICDATANMGLRRTGSNDQILHETLDLCARPAMLARWSARSMTMSIASSARRCAGNALKIAARRQSR